MGTSPNIGGILPRVAQQEETSAPKKPVADALSTSSPDSVLRSVLTEYPGFAKNFNANNTSLVFANGERAQRGLKERGGLEFWSPNESGTPDYPSPAPGKNVLEIYSNDLKNNPTALKQAVYGDLMHGMASDPYWKGLRDQFMESFTPEEINRQQKGKTWWDDVNGSKQRFGPTYDAYIRGWIANEGEGHQGQAESGNTMYSPRQLQVLQEMQNYLTTGKEAPHGKQAAR